MQEKLEWMHLAFSMNQLAWLPSSINLTNLRSMQSCSFASCMTSKQIDGMSLRNNATPLNSVALHNYYSDINGKKFSIKGCSVLLLGLLLSHYHVHFASGEGGGGDDSWWFSRCDVKSIKQVSLEYQPLKTIHHKFLQLQIRNQRMTEDQSVVGKRWIYYVQHDNMTLLCSESDEENTEPEEEKQHEFSEGEDLIVVRKDSHESFFCMVRTVCGPIDTCIKIQGNATPETLCTKCS